MKRAVRNMAMWVVAASVSLALTGCEGFFVPVNNNGGGGGTANSGDYVYVANANPSNASLAGFSLSSSGALTAVSGSPYTLNFVPTSLAITPNNTFLYVGGTTGLYSYAIGANGSLSLVSNSGSSIPVAAVAISPDGNYLFALQSNVVVGSNVTPTAYSITIDEYSIASSGVLTLLATPAYTTTSGAFTPQAISVSPNGGYVMAALGSAGDIVFTLSSGTLSTTVQVLGEANLSSDNAIAFDSTSTHVFIARSGTSSGLAVYTVSSGGVLNQVGTVSAAGNQPSAVTLGSGGSYAYVTNRGDSSLSAFVITAGFGLQPLPVTPFSTGSQPGAVGVDHSGKYLLTASSGGSPDLQVFTVNSNTGELATNTSSTTGTDPTLPIAMALTH